MKVLHHTLLFFLLAISIKSFSQEVMTPITVEFEPITTLVKLPLAVTITAQVQPTIPVSFSHWTKRNVVGFDLNEIAFSNWNAGGVSSVSGLIKGEFTRIHTLNKSKWFNELIVRYGVNKQDGNAIRKSDDAIRLTSTFGYRNDTISNWYHSARLNFNTQFTNGYNYPNTSSAISKPFAPAYTFLGVGAEYFNKKQKLNVYISPLTMKNTLVLDQTLANQGAFGVQKAIYDTNGNVIVKGSKSKTEIGFLVTNFYKKEVLKNITLENRLNLYSDYINNFGNVDVDWELKFDLIVNQYVRANIGSHVIYDDDIKAKKEINGTQTIIGSKIQLKQILGVGLAYAF